MRWIVGLAGLLALAMAACGSDSGGGDKPAPKGSGGSRVSSVKGQLQGVAAKGAKVAVVVGEMKQGVKAAKQIMADVKPDGTFQANNLPEGPKTVLVGNGSQNTPVEYPKNESDPNAYSSTIPEEPATEPGSGTGSLHTLAVGPANGVIDLGTIKPSADGKRFDPSNNPLSQLDSDGDGIVDYKDGDVDGDGVPNAQDSSPWGPAYEGWGWGSEEAPVFDSDADGTPNWSDSDYAGSDYCKPADDACWEALYCATYPEDCSGGQINSGNQDACLMFPEDLACSGAGGSGGAGGSAGQGGGGSGGSGGEGDPCASMPGDPSCCAAYPSSPSCPG
jgi:hypothetical protein